MPDEASNSADDAASLSQEATNESTPEKALTDQKAVQTPKLKIPPKRSHAPNPTQD